MTNTFSSGLKSALSMEGRGIRQACQKPAGERKSWKILGIHRYGDALRRRTRAHRIVKGPAHAHRPGCPALLAARALHRPLPESGPTKRQPTGRLTARVGRGG